MKKKKTASRQRSKGIVVGHILPVRANAKHLHGWLVCVTTEQGDHALAIPEFERAILSMSPSMRSKIKPGIFWVADERLDVDALRDVMENTSLDSGYEEVAFCDDCELGEPCGAMGNPSAGEVFGFLPCPPPPAELDPEAVHAMTSLLLEADDDGLAFDLMQAALARFCGLRPKPVVKTAPTMTSEEAIEVLKVDPLYVRNRSYVATAFQHAVIKAHPDTGGSNEALQRVTEAKRTLDALTADPS